MQARKASPFSMQDVWRPSSESWSLHDIVNRFLWFEMKIATPITELPSLPAIIIAMECTKFQENKDFIFDLGSTKIEDILLNGVPIEMTPLWFALESCNFID